MGAGIDGAEGKREATLARHKAISGQPFPQPESWDFGAAASAFGQQGMSPMSSEAASA
jgi:hypothetical protein